MDTITIKQSIQNWIAIINDADAVNEKFLQGNCFNYDVSPDLLSDGQVHVYPGIFEGRLLFFVIPAQYDNENYEDVIGEYTAVCPIVFNLGGSHEISEPVAQARMLAWQDNYQTWVPQQIATIDGLFQAFVVDTVDFQAKKVIVSLALKTSVDKPEFVADLIISNDMKDYISYDDFTHPVPPYGSAAMAKENFYLLS